MNVKIIKQKFCKLKYIYIKFEKKEQCLRLVEIGLVNGNRFKKLVNLKYKKKKE